MTNAESTDQQLIFSDGKLFTEEQNQWAEQATDRPADRHCASPLFWHTGRHINGEVLQDQRTEYGKQAIPILPVQLECMYRPNLPGLQNGYPLKQKHASRHRKKASPGAGRGERMSGTPEITRIDQ